MFHISGKSNFFQLIFYFEIARRGNIQHNHDILNKKLFGKPTAVKVIFFKYTFSTS